MIDWIVWSVSWVLLLIGCVFVVTGAVGMIRMPDLYTRLHAGSVTDTGGAIFISLALILQSVFVFGSAMAAIKVLLIMFFTLFTAPTASHALAKTALLSGLVPVDIDGKPILDSPEEATLMARSRTADYQSGQDAEVILEETRKHRKTRSSHSDGGNS
ncbi:monovalent cation/H(+) antiporter subunit G [Granulosicoccus antarcticus]|uniref:Na(+)/H(+) antiporter subunit G n=1 Tax=Granulosicoccus antarcticus IMCC3135 TaxID=1192854 RepID=A0A2Z2NNF2_9GAMM|nr:monovalent cation/H(+) antiporter subunit G [Granulosicoccus antarcticus]ASJ72936.1 Na(+)/H(+) antiporter subunit G [Granulosicoccus antarcticus IMCC3135]